MVLMLVNIARVVIATRKDVIKLRLASFDIPARDNIQQYQWHDPIIQ